MRIQRLVREPSFNSVLMVPFSFPGIKEEIQAVLP